MKLWPMAHGPWRRTETWTEDVTLTYQQRLVSWEAEISWELPPTSWVRSSSSGPQLEVPSSYVTLCRVRVRVQMPSLPAGQQVLARLFGPGRRHLARTVELVLELLQNKEEPKSPGVSWLPRTRSHTVTSATLLRAHGRSTQEAEFTFYF